MSPRSIGELAVREVALLEQDTTIVAAAATIVRADVPALPVVDAQRRLVGLFGEREFMTALFPGYLGELSYAAFVPRSLDERLEKRPGAREEPVGRHMNTEHVDVTPAPSDAQLAETFLHHRVLVVPIVETDRTVVGIITRSDFFRALVERVGPGS